MALTSKDCRKMIQMAADNKMKLMVVKQNRYNVPIVLTKKALDQGKLGRIFMTEVNVFWNRGDAYYSDSPWRGKRRYEGGALYTQASHFIDLLIWFFGDVKKAKTVVDTKNHTIGFEDCGSSILTFASGVMGIVNWTTCIYRKNYEGSITIIGEKGTVKIGGQYLNAIDYWDVFDNPLPKNLTFDDKPNEYGQYQGSSSNHDKVIKDVIASILGKKNTVVGGFEGLKTVQAIELMYKHIR
jgi:predicted dehydrogenase